MGDFLYLAMHVQTEMCGEEVHKPQQTNHKFLSVHIEIL